MDRLSRMGLKNENCQLHGDFNYHPSLCPLIDESNVFEVENFNIDNMFHH